jgi:hypothetical protein
MDLLSIWLGFMWLRIGSNEYNKYFFWFHKQRGIHETQRFVCYILKGLPRDPLSSRFAFTCCLSTICCNIILVLTFRSPKKFVFIFRPKFLKIYHLHKRGTRSAHSTYFDFTLTSVIEPHKLGLSSLCNFLHTFVTPSFLGPNVISNTLFSDIFQVLPSKLETNFRTHTKIT